MNIRTNNNTDDIAYDYMYLGLADYRKSLDTHNDSLLYQAKAKNMRAYNIFKSTENSTFIVDACRNLMNIYLRFAQTATGSQRKSYMDSCQMFHEIGVNTIKKIKNYTDEIDFLLWESKYFLINKEYGNSRKKLNEIEAAIEKDPLKSYFVKYGYMMASFNEAMGNYDKSFEWAYWATKVEKRQLNREFAVRSAQLSLKTEQDNILLQNEINREHEYIIHREQEIRLVVITASSALVLVMITILVIVIRNSLKRKKRLGLKLMKRNEELESQRDQLECINDQIASSINFAHHLQISMLPSIKQMNEMFGQTLILWRPLDLVSGDFYWATQCGSRKIVTIADCTGHGVSGGFMSMLGISILSDISLTPEFKNGQMSAGDVLDIMRDKVVESLRQSEDGAMALDGMDMALCIIEEGSTTIQFAGAFRPIQVFHNGVLTEYKGDRMPISYLSSTPRPFNTVQIDIEHGDTIFIYSDGITDQFGYNDNGEQTKFAGRRLKKILEENADKPLDEIQRLIETAIDNWRSPAQQRTLPQTDDILLLGIRF
jgi:serine phosphatase RsbU (regulator of sigma subunit)